MNATLRIGTTRQPVNLIVTPEGSPDGVIRLYLAGEWLELPGETADELARLIAKYRKDQVQS